MECSFLEPATLEVLANIKSVNNQSPCQYQPKSVPRSPYTKNQRQPKHQ